MTCDKSKASADLTLLKETMTQNGEKTGLPLKMFKDQTMNINPLAPEFPFKF